MDKNQDLHPKYVVGLGASAGGLNALEQFFDYMPVNSDMTFIIIQHLSPDFKSLMDDLLARHTTMKIHHVINGMELEKNSIYLIPPKTQMTISNQRLYLTEKGKNLSLDLPIDVFFHSLAEDVKDRSIGIILSGTGTDGSRGIQSIHQAGGLVIVQSVESAQFDGMPRSAIATEQVDCVIPPEKMPEALIEYMKNPLNFKEKFDSRLDMDEDHGDYMEIFGILKKNFKIDFSKYKSTTVGRRIERRMEFRQIKEVSDYALIISSDVTELDALYKDLLIGVTEFFRDPKIFKLLETELIPKLLEGHSENDDIRVWSAGCATGEEAYSLAILFHEVAEKVGYIGKITIFATDVHKSSLDFASIGSYEEQRLKNVSSKRLRKYFNNHNNNGHKINSEIRKMVVFAPHNLISDPPFTKMDLVCCRNLLIYFQPEIQEKVISLFHFSLKKNGILFLGSSEGLGKMVNEFEVIDNQGKLFNKIRDLKLAIDFNQTVSQTQTPSSNLISLLTKSTVNIDRQLFYDYNTLLKRFIPAGILVNDQYQVLHYFGDLSEFLKIPEGRASNEVTNIVIDDLKIALSTALHKSSKNHSSVESKHLRLREKENDIYVNLLIDPIVDEKIQSWHYFIQFQRITQTEHIIRDEKKDIIDISGSDSSVQLFQRVSDLDLELQSTKENLQNTIEELQTSNEELQATNEELLASNEELQSTNEELHSVNEELYTVNSEFEIKNKELKQLNQDHENLLASTEFGIIFLDRNLKIRKYNPALLRFFKLLPHDIGRPIDHIAYHLSDHSDMLSEIQHVLFKGQNIEKEVKSQDGRWILKRILPFKTENNFIEGVVLTFTDIDRIKRVEEELFQINQDLEKKIDARTKDIKETNLKLENEMAEKQKVTIALEDSLKKYMILFDLSPIGITISDKEGNILEANKESERILGITREEQAWRRIDDGKWKIIRPDGSNMPSEEFASVRAMKENCLIRNVKMGIVKENNSIIWINVSATPLPIEKLGVIIAYQDITQQTEAEFLLKQASDENFYIFTYSNYMSCILDSGGYFMKINPAWEKSLGWKENQILCHKFINFLSDDDQKITIRNFEKLMLDGNIIQFENKFKNSNGNFCWLIWNAAYDSERKLIYATAIDITERKKAESERIRLQNLESLGILAGGLAHDFNNMLSSIMGNSSMAYDDIPNEATKKLIKNIEKTAKRASGLTQQLLTFARGGITEKTHINIEKVIKDTAKFALSGSNLEAVFDLNNTFEIFADESQINQVFQNIIINSMQAMPLGGKIIIRTENYLDNENKKYIRIMISDTGVGMSPEIIERIFDPYFTTKQTGSGLGLSVCHSIILKHEGKIEVKSVVGSGTDIFILLPAQDKIEEIAIYTKPDLMKSSYHVLLMDDDEEIREVLSTQLIRMGHTFELSKDGGEAIEKYIKAKDNGKPFDLVFMDLTIKGGMGGKEAVKKLREFDQNAKVIVSSGYSFDTDTLYIKEGFNGSLKKPYTKDEIKTIINFVMNKV